VLVFFSNMSRSLIALYGGCCLGVVRCEDMSVSSTSPAVVSNVLAKRLLDNVGSVLLGSPEATKLASVAAIAGLHLLIQDVPGVGKTLLAGALAKSLGVESRRIQGHPDLLPSDICGVTIWDPRIGEWEFKPGPIFASVVLLDELNRTPPKTQSALLEAMEEGQVSVAGDTWPLPVPHMVIATQNPQEQHGTYPLVESQLDRFGMCIHIGYPPFAVEQQLAVTGGQRGLLDNLQPVCLVGEWERLQAQVLDVEVDERISDYAMRVVQATRDDTKIKLGVSPRGTIQLLLAAKALALVEGFTYVSPQHIAELVVPVLAHRIMPYAPQESRELLIRQIVESVPSPRP